MTVFRKAVIAAATAAAIAGSQALAADISLPPGKPAGVHEAQHSPSLLLIGGMAAAVVVVVAVAVAVSNNGNCDDASCITTSPTSTVSTAS